MAEAPPGPDAFDTGALLAGLRRWVEIETPSDAPEAVNRLLDMVQADLAGLPLAAERIPGRRRC